MRSNPCFLPLGAVSPAYSTQEPAPRQVSYYCLACYDSYSFFLYSLMKTLEDYRFCLLYELTSAFHYSSFNELFYFFTKKR